MRRVRGKAGLGAAAVAGAGAFAVGGPVGLAAGAALGGLSALTLSFVGSGAGCDALRDGYLAELKLRRAQFEECGWRPKSAAF